ncbi:RusA family crossover junction endodeoxyribonuclease [Staphylococcus gallinarum]|uniref:RusA family crossover junction endodeoxyribonuclease n=1 Tax=Staphylococcus gallinarum TaxID=1293 RepID=UPI0030EEAFF5
MTMDKQCRLSLPLPTSLNKLYVQHYSGGRFTGKKILSKVGKENREDIMINVERQMSIPTNIDWDFEYTKTNYIYMDIVAYVTRVNVDLDNTLKTLNDSIEASGLVFENDKKVVPRFDRVYIDPSNPRVELTFKQTGWNGIFPDKNTMNDFETNCMYCSRYRKGGCSILKGALNNKVQETINYNEQGFTCNKYKRRVVKNEL